MDALYKEYHAMDDCEKLELIQGLYGHLATLLDEAQCLALDGHVVSLKTEDLPMKALEDIQRILRAAQFMTEAIEILALSKQGEDSASHGK